MRFRSPLPADAQAVLTLLVERDIADIGTPDITLESLHEEWSRGDFDLAADARVVEAADRRIVGYAAMSREVTMLVVVATDHEGRGIGSRLRRWAEQRDRARGSARHSQWIAAGNQPARALLLTAGYRPARSYWRLARTLDDVHKDASPPDGVTLRPVQVDQDAPALHTLNEVSFKASADYRPHSFTAFYDEHLRPHDFDRELSHVAEADGRPVGFLLARRRRQENAGFIDLLGVHPEHRTRGLATAMLQDAFARFAAAGLRQVELGVASDNPNALRLYERCGMTKRFRYDTYEHAAGKSANETHATAGEPRPEGSNTKIRSATEAEAARLEALQRRSSDIWTQYREQLAAHP
jgi:mycothiol synthase